MRRFLVLLVFALSSGFAFASLPDFTDLINNTSPSVVKINTTSTSSVARQDFDLNAIPPQMRELFERFNQQQPQRGGIGSGFIISSDGYVVTNHHVIDDAGEISVRLNDRREYIAEVIGTDPGSDIALLKIDEVDLPIAQFAESGDIEVGDWVLAIGSPFDLDYSASAGIVSAIGRSLPNNGGQNYVPFIQTDVAINPGNSGGPLFNLEGKVVGINSQIYSRSGGFMGLSFSIPASVALDVIGQLRDRGTVSRGWLGVQISDVNIDQAKAFGLPKPRGALISQVFADSPAANSGLRAGDVILEFDGKDIQYSYDLPHVVGLIQPGKVVSAQVYRQQEITDIEVTVGELAQNGVSRVSTPEKKNQPTKDGALGLKLEDMNRRELTSSGVNNGIRVTAVEDNSPAQKAGLDIGDVIVQLNFEDVSTSDQFQDIVERAKGEARLPILFYRQGSSIFRTIQVDD